MIKINTVLNSVKNGPLISIVITNYKNELYLEKAITSCLKQTYSNLEIMVIDDASSKGKCLQIIKNLKDKRISLYHTNINYGTYACRNFALDYANGVYITFLDADDWIEEKHIENLFSIIKKNNFIGVCSLYNRYDKNGKKVKGPILCEASILLDRIKALDTVGYYHMVRAGADTEYRERLIKIHGKNKFAVLMNATYNSLSKDNSLTTNCLIGKNSISRVKYVHSYMKKHSINNKLFYNYKNKDANINLEIDDNISVKNFNILNYKKII